jgi:hypothetical protein
MCMPQTFGISCEIESNWPDALSEAHRGYILAFMESEQTREEALINSFFAYQQEQPPARLMFHFGGSAADGR